MRDRVIGIENEYGSIVQLPNGSYSNAGTETFEFDYEESSMLRSELSVAGRTRHANGFFWDDTNLWLPNGGCFYVDTTGEHLEYASPEARRFRDVVRYNRAGERIVGDLFPPLESGRRNIFLKHNVAPSGPGGILTETFGCHENYLFRGMSPTSQMWPPPAVASKEGSYFLPFITFLVTRQIIDGAGHWISPEKDIFGFSQRASFIRAVMSHDTTQATRAIINLRCSNHADGMVNHHRLHLILGDANILEYALWLKVGITALVLSMREDDAEFPTFLEMLEDPQEAMRTLSKMHDPRERCLRFLDKTTRSPLEVQFAFCEAARKYLGLTSFDSEESEADAKEMCAEWEKTLNALARNDTNWLVGRLDYITKHFLVEAHLAHAKRVAGKEITTEEAGRIRQGLDIVYHDITTPLKALEKILARSPEKRVVSENEILRAKDTPPRDTRAYARGRVIKEYLGARGSIYCIGWDFVALKPSKTFVCGDPLNAEPPWLHGILKGEPPWELCNSGRYAIPPHARYICEDIF